LKQKLISPPILKGPNWELHFHIHIDASKKSLGDALGQHEDEKRNVMYFINESILGVELNYIVTEKKFLVVVYAINKF